MSNDLANIPQPAVIEVLSFEGVFADMQDDLVDRFPAVEPVLQLESAITNKLMEVSAYRELMMRARINDAAKANLVAFANGSDLDHLAAFYDVARLSGEDDETFRARIILAIQARSPGGSAYWYQAAALRADVRIQSVAVFREEFFPIIHIAVLSRENDGIPDEAMLDAVNSLVQSDEVRLLNDTLIVEPAVTTGTEIEVNIWLLPSAPLSVVDNMEQGIRKSWKAEAGIGFDLVPSWIEARLHTPGVQRVEVVTPSNRVVATQGTAISLGEIKINYMGRDY